MKNTFSNKNSSVDFGVLEKILKHSIFQDFPITDDLKKRFELLSMYMQEELVLFFKDSKKQISLTSFHEEKMIKNIQNELDRVFSILEKLAPYNFIPKNSLRNALASESHYLILLAQIKSQDVLFFEHFYIEIAQRYGTDISVLKFFLDQNEILPLVLGGEIQFVGKNFQAVRFQARSAEGKNGQFYYDIRNKEYKKFEASDANLSPENSHEAYLADLNNE